MREDQTEEIIIVKRITSNAWIKDLNINNKDKVIGSFKNADGSRAKTSIGVGINKDTGLRKVILTPEEQSKFELELGMDKGSLGPVSDYWITFKVDIEGSEIILKPNSNSFDALKLKVLRSKTIVADGLEELKTNAYAEFVIISESEEAKKANTVRDIRKKAYSKFNTMDTQDMEDVLVAMGKKPTGMSRELLEDAVGKEVDVNPKFFLDIYTNPKFKEFVYIKKLINIGILLQKGEAVIYGEDVIGYDINTAIDYLNNPENKTILSTINSAFSIKKKNIKK